MPLYKQLLLLFIFVYPLICFGQTKAGFTVTNNGVLKTVKNGDTIFVCAGNSVIYKNTSININNIAWKFSNGSPQTSGSFVQTVYYATAGVGKTVQTITDFNNKIDSLVAYVKVSNIDANLKSSFSYSPNTGDKCGSDVYQFISTSTGNNLSYKWDFGDDSSSITKNTTHSFNSAVGANGTENFTVMLTVTDMNGCSATSKQTVTVLKVPDASLTNDVNNSTLNPILFNGLPTFQLCENRNSYQFIFVNNSSTESINTKYTIDWGDNSGTRTLSSSWKVNDTIMHTYALGLHTLTIKVEGINGCAGTKKYNVFIGTAPVGNFGPSEQNEKDFCVGDVGNFSITKADDNPPGTIYKISFDDGSADSVYTQPPPAIIHHTFLSTSCYNVSGHFTATCIISNPCNSLVVTAAPYYVSTSASANMRIDSVACLNSETTVSNTSNYGSASTDFGCSNSGLQVWKIFPSTGYTITSGKFGSRNNNDTDWTKWADGSSSLDIKFTTPGVYTITLYISNTTKCGFDSITKTICARSNPQALFKITGTIKCTSDTLTLQNNSASASCFGDVYKWMISTMDNEDCGTGAQPAFIKGNDTTKSPQVWFKEPGNYTIKLRATALGTDNTCFVESNDTITIKGKPKIKINTLTDICVGNSTNPIAFVTNCYSSTEPTYNWTFINGNPNSSTKDIPGTVMYNVVGLQSIKLNVTNECGVSSDSTSVNVIAKPVAEAGADKQFCSGTSVVIGSAAVNGYSYSWSPKNGLNNTAIATPSLSLVYNGSNTDTTYKYFVTASLGTDCFSVDSVTVTVKKSPVVTTIPLSASVCKGNSITLVAKGAINYVWSPATYLNTTTNDTVIVKPDTSITYKIVGSLNNGCADSANITVTLNPDAKADFTQKFISGCAPFNLDTVISVTAYNDRNLTYKFYANNVLIGSNNTGVFPSYTLKNADDSVIIKMITVSKFGCKDDSIQQKFYSGIGVSASFKKNFSDGCEPLSVQFTNTSSNISSTNFLWNFGNGESSINAQPDTILFHTGSLHNDTTYFISLNAFNGCASQIFKDSIHVKALPLARFGVNNTFGCSPDTLLITNTSLGNPSEYYWDFDDGNIYTTSSQSVFQHVYSTGISDTFTIRLTAENACGKDSLPLDVVVEPNTIKAQVNVFGSDLYGCVPHSVTFNNNTVGAATALWSFGDNTYEFLDGNQVIVEHNYTDTGTFNIVVNFNNGCSDTAVYQQVVVYTHPFAALTTDKSIYCFGDSTHINISSATGDINRLFWGDNNLYYSPPVTSHYYSNLGFYTIKLYADRVSAYGTVCSDSVSQLIKIAERPVTSITSSNDIDCFTNSSNLKITGGAYYVWYPDSTLTNGKISNPVAKPLATTNYKVNITGSSGCVIQDSVLVKVDFSNGSNAYLIPSAFTPNSDGLNDCIRIKYPGYIQEMDLQIYNRWGELLFHATNPAQCWDGTSLHNGNIIKQPAGAYIYTLRIKSICTAHTDLFQKGTIVLIR